MPLDPRGITYDITWTDNDGTGHYRRDRAAGYAEGPAWWSDTHDRNAHCGHHLAAFCRSCNLCLHCAGCYCDPYDD